jgi:hypothetical protein
VQPTTTPPAAIGGYLEHDGPGSCHDVVADGFIASSAGAARKLIQIAGRKLIHPAV